MNIYIILLMLIFILMCRLSIVNQKKLYSKCSSKICSECGHLKRTHYINVCGGKGDDGRVRYYCSKDRELTITTMDECNDFKKGGI